MLEQEEEVREHQEGGGHKAMWASPETPQGQVHCHPGQPPTSLPYRKFQAHIFQQKKTGWFCCPRTGRRDP